MEARRGAFFFAARLHGLSGRRYARSAKADEVPPGNSCMVEILSAVVFEVFILELIESPSIQCAGVFLGCWVVRSKCRIRSTSRPSTRLRSVGSLHALQRRRDLDGRSVAGDRMRGATVPHMAGYSMLQGRFNDRSENPIRIL